MNCAPVVAELTEEPLGRAQDAAADVFLEVFKDSSEELGQLAALDVDQVLQGIMVGVVHEVLSEINLIKVTYSQSCSQL